MSRLPPHWKFSAHGASRDDGLLVECSVERKGAGWVARWYGCVEAGPLDETYPELGGEDIAVLPHDRPLALRQVVDTADSRWPRVEAAAEAYARTSSGALRLTTEYEDPEA